MSRLICSLPQPAETTESDTGWKALSAGPQERLRILQRYRRIAMVGLSANHMRPSHFAAIFLINRGYDVVPVNPGAETILGRPCYPDIASIPDPVEVVDIFRPSAFVPPIVEQAIEARARVVWMQFEVIHAAAARRALDAGLEVVMDQCMKVEHARFFGGMSTIGLNTQVVSSRSWKPSDGLHDL